MKSVLVFCLLALSVSSSAQTDTMFVGESPLYKCWIDSHEENEKGSKILIYRPCDYYKRFTSSRFRAKFEFNKNGQCSFLVLAPDDAHYMTTGSWKFIDNQRSILIIKDTAGKIVYQYKIVSVSNDMLKLEGYW